MDTKHFSRTLFILLGLACALPAQADGIKPGLWEITHQGGGALSSQMAQMQAQLAAMPPEQRKQVEAMMAKQGMKLGGGAGGLTMQACITPEQAKHDAIPVQDDKHKCTSTPVRSGNTVKISYTCKSTPPSSGQAEITFDGDTAYTMKVHGTQDGQVIDTQMSGRWIGTDCGNVKPAGTR